jgi:hypothetical protein
MTSTGPRDRILLMILPALLIAIGYGWKYSGLRARVSAAEADAAGARGAAVSDAQLAAAQAKLRELTAELTTTEAGKTAARERWFALWAERAVDANRRADAIRSLERVLKQSGLQLLDQTHAETNDQAKLPVGIIRMARLLAEGTKSGLKPPTAEPDGAKGAAASRAPGAAASVTPPARTTGPGDKNYPLWRVRFVGQYAQLVAALDRLAVEEPLLIPVHITMGEAPLDSHVRTWTLWVWM